MENRSTKLFSLYEFSYERVFCGRWLISACLILTSLAGCSWNHNKQQSSNTETGYYPSTVKLSKQKRNPEFTHYDDGAPNVKLNPDEIQNAIPRYEKRKRAGNPRYYTIAGETYWILNETRDFKETGQASWYGTQYHGKKTSNGEVYDMYAMSAAHKTLPIPTYVRVTRQDNGKQIIVRVNDRGPFIDGRIIDLSYAAATKLGMLGSGITPVRIEAIDTSSPTYRYAENSITPSTNSNSEISDIAAVKTDFQNAYKHGSHLQNRNKHKDVYVQVGIFSQQTIANSVSSLLKGYDFPTEVVATDSDHHKVRLGPFNGKQEATKAKQKYQQKGLGNDAILVHD